ncbi:hypothetical protein BH10CYA1_BH10CYA1_50960 [soil metagenome]
MKSEDQKFLHNLRKLLSTTDFKPFRCSISDSAGRLIFNQERMSSAAIVDRDTDLLIINELVWVANARKPGRCWVRAYAVA